MDVMLYIKKYKLKIDFDKFENAVSSLNYLRLYEAIKCLAIKFIKKILNEKCALLQSFICQKECSGDG